MKGGLVKYTLVYNLCSGVWCETFGIIKAAAVGFLYMANCRLFSSFELAMYTKLILIPDSSFMLNCIEGVETVNVFKTLWILVVLA